MIMKGGNSMWINIIDYDGVEVSFNKMSELIRHMEKYQMPYVTIKSMEFWGAKLKANIPYRLSELKKIEEDKQ